ncbi:metallophosphoesterase family protein [Bdellovibrio reynosensis]|uniref:Metallophosphoesterase n=1 Tax=Bdellovibrio reynosensis TaxID=2835041 RepID=A0ABY4CD69_9BACT|nr:metallophosphoesterase [Bdellovibrio reynosensis]UOF02892.1 metallophosphoesterase [Bdellovibrio reynosensis]
MKIHAISDTHGNHHAFDKILSGGDLIVHCGDSDCNDTESSDKFFKWCLNISSRYSKGMILTGGNHDSYLAGHIAEIKNFLSNSNVHLLLNEFVDLEGFKAFGSPCSILYSDTWNSFADTDRELSKNCWQQIPNQLDLLVTHSPPFNILDGGMGSPGLLEKIKEAQPKLHIFGHIHQFGGVYDTLSSVFVNAASLGSLGSSPKYPFEIEYDLLSREVVSVKRSSFY